MDYGRVVFPICAARGGWGNYLKKARATEEPQFRDDGEIRRDGSAGIPASAG